MTIFAFLIIFKKIREMVVQKLIMIKDEMIWSGIIKSIMLTYLKNFASFLLACKLIAIEGISGGVIFSIIISGSILIFFPVWSMRHLIKNKDNLYDEKFRKKYNGLYGELK